jgi:hypothetical protein
VVLVDGHQHRSAFVLYQEYEEFRGFGLACISPNDVNITGAFIKALTRRQSSIDVDGDLDRRPLQPAAFSKRFRNMRWLPLRPGYDLTTWWVPKASQKYKNETAG